MDYSSIYSSDYSGSTYSFIGDGRECSVFSYPYSNVTGRQNDEKSSIIVPEGHNIPFFKGSQMVSVPENVFEQIPSEKKKVKIRYNHHCKSHRDMWKLYVDNEVHIVGQVNFEIPTATTLDFDEDTKDYKAHISCNAKIVKFETMPDENDTIIIATIS